MELWQEDLTAQEKRKRNIAEAEALLEAAERHDYAYRDREVFLHQIWLLLDGTPPLEMVCNKAVFHRFHRLTRQMIQERDEHLREARAKGQLR